MLIGAACTLPKNTLLSKNVPLSNAQIETSHAKPPDTLAKTTIQASYSKLPLSFESNQGQTDSQVQFFSRGSGYTLFLTPTEAVLSLRQKAEGGKQKAGESVDFGLRTPDAGLTLRMQLLGANPDPQVTGQKELPGKVNYFLGNDPTKWRTNVPTYVKVKYQGVYPGVDLVYYGNQRQLEYDFVVAPGADPKIIQLAFNGVGAIHELPLQIDANGDLLLQTAGGEVRFLQPRIYQEIGGIKQPISGRYVLLSSPLTTESIESPLPQGEGQGEGAHRVGFEVAAYDTNKPLVIDPVLSYSTYLGGSGNEADTHIAVDTSGNAYVMGYTNSVDLLTTPGAPQSTFGGGSYDAFVSKLDPTGSMLLYSTYLGGSSREIAAGVAVDLSGNAYVTGYTSSTNFPTLNPLQAVNGGSEDVFLAKLNFAGSLVYSTYLGGSAEDSTVAITVDISDNAYITGVTQSSNFPVTVNAFQPTYRGGSGSLGDAFVAKIDPSQPPALQLVYSTYLGGSAREVGQGLAVDSSGNVYVTGYTQSGDFPTVNPLQATHSGGTYDAFVTKIDPSQSPTNQLVYSTYLGGSNADQGLGITVDIAGNAYVTGNTQGDFPTTANPLQADQGGNDAFVTKIDPSQLPTNQLVYSTYLGGSGDDVGVDIAVDSLGNAYVAGQTSSSDFPTVNPLQAVYGGGDFDAFVVKLDASGSAFVYSTYLGSGGFDGSRGWCIAMAPNW